MLVQKFKAGDGTVVGAAPGQVVGVTATLDTLNNAVVLNWTAITKPTWVVNTYYQIAYSRNADFDTISPATEIYTFVGGAPIAIGQNLYWASGAEWETAPAGAPTLQQGSKYVLLRETTSYNNVNLYIGMDGSAGKLIAPTSTNFYFKVRACFVNPSTTPPITPNITNQLNYPDQYGNWGAWSAVASALGVVYVGASILVKDANTLDPGYAYEEGVSYQPIVYTNGYQTALNKSANTKVYVRLEAPSMLEYIIWNDTDTEPTTWKSLGAGGITILDPADPVILPADVYNIKDSEGLRTVKAKFRNGGVTSTTYSTTITFDKTPPICGLGTISSRTSSTIVSIPLTGVSSDTVAVMVYTSAPSLIESVNGIPAAVNKYIGLSSLANPNIIPVTFTSVEGERSLKIFLLDNAGNQSVDDPLRQISITYSITGPPTEIVGIGPKSPVNMVVYSRPITRYSSEETNPVVIPVLKGKIDPSGVQIKITSDPPAGNVFPTHAIGVIGTESGKNNFVEDIGLTYEGKTVFTIVTYDATTPTPNSTTTIFNAFLDQHGPEFESITSADFLDVNRTVNKRNVSLTITCKDMCNASVRITGDIDDPWISTDYRPLSGVITLDGVLHTQTGTFIISLTEGDGTKQLTLELLDEVGNKTIVSDSTVIIRLDTSGGAAPTNLEAETFFPVGLYENHIVLTWEEPATNDVHHYRIYERTEPPYDFGDNPPPNRPIEDATYITVNNATTYTIDNIEDILIIRHYRVTAVKNVTGNESPFSNEAIANFAQPITVNFDFSHVNSSAIPVGVMVVPRYLSRGGVIPKVTPSALVSYIAEQYGHSRTGWNDLILRVNVWDYNMDNPITKDKGGWVIYTSATPGSSTYEIKEAEGIAIEFIAGTPAVEIVFDGLPWSTGNYTMTLRQGLNFVGIPRDDFSDIVTFSNRLDGAAVEASYWRDTQQLWDPYVAELSYVPESMQEIISWKPVFIKLNEEKSIIFTGDIHQE